MQKNLKEIEKSHQYMKTANWKYTNMKIKGTKNKGLRILSGIHLVYT